MAAAAAEALPAARLESVRALSGLFREAQPRETAEESVFQDVLEILTSTSSAIEQSFKDSCGLADPDTCLLLIAECFRCLRNACVECAKNQHVLRNLGLISTSVHLIKLLHGIQIKEELLLTEHLQQGFQLCDFMVPNRVNLMQPPVEKNLVLVVCSKILEGCGKILIRKAHGILIGWQNGNLSSSASTFSCFCCKNMEGHGRKLPQIVPGEVHIRYQGKFLHGKGGQALEWAAQGLELPSWRYSQKVHPQNCYFFLYLPSLIRTSLLDKGSVALRCSLQFLGNIAAGNGDSQNSIWKCAFPDLFLTCLTYSDEKIVSYCCMVLFTCLNSERVRELLDPGNLPVALHVLRVYKEQLDSEWSFLIVTEHLLKCPELVKALYAKLSNQERVTLLELMMVKVSDKNPVSSEEMNVFVRHADFLADCFQEKCGAVLRLTAAAAAEDEEALVTIRLLDVLCEMTSNSSLLEHLQAFPGLLETAVDTLRLTHLAGKQAVNIFTATHAVTRQEEISHPAVGFKSHLIRLIGNLCYKNKENQDKVYDLDGISLILDNCSIDDNNPFVSQWAVYALRNLTEQNEQNQALIAQMERKGLADSSALQSMGLEIQQRDGKLILQSTRKKPS